MRCPFCENAETKVIDSRLANEGDLVRRRRECMTCSERFTTFESAELVMPRIVKSDGSRVPFDEQKLLNGVQRALDKRPVDVDQIEATINRIKRLLRSIGDREITSKFVGETVMQELRELDQVAYVRFASVYRSFQDVSEFKEEIDKLESEPTEEEKRMQMSLLVKNENTSTLNKK